MDSKQIFFIIFLIFITSCSRQSEIQFSDYGKDYPLPLKMCLASSFKFDENLSSDEIIINNYEQYKSLFQIIHSKWCENLTMPSIDFSQKTLLGKYASGSCGASFEKNVIRDDSKKEYKYRIYVKESFCISGPPQESMNYILVPKVPDDYKVVFEVKGAKNTGKIEILTKPGERVNFTEEELRLQKKEGIGILSDENICSLDSDCIIREINCGNCKPLRRCLNKGVNLNCSLADNNCQLTLEINNCKCINWKCAECKGNECATH